MSGSANKGWLRWCYSLVESSMNDAVRIERSLSTAPSALQGTRRGKCGRPEGRSPDTLLGPETSGPCE
jgi:hypothetical protein